MRLPGVVAVVLCVSGAELSSPGGLGEPPLRSHAGRPAGIFRDGLLLLAHDQSDYLSVIATADRESLHLEARYNYEALDTGSVFAGWNFSGGDGLKCELTPILGAVFGAKQGIAPGFEASVAYGIVDSHRGRIHA